jgi:tetratricopeptide (TPR) repeat protein
MPGRKKASAAWEQFPYTSGAYEFRAASLRRNWARLHAGDAEPWPDAGRVAASLARGPARELLAEQLDGEALAIAVQEAWRAFHRGDFATAWRDGGRLGPAGVVAAVKAAGVYAAYLENDAGRAEQLLLDAATLAEQAAAAAPGYANAHYFHAFVLGRYSQRVSVLQALAAGHAARVRKSLDRALQIEPKHADAHLALGLYHAEIVAKVGGIAAKLTYGASASEAEKHFERAIALNPESPLCPLEFANGLVMLHGAKARRRADELYRRAAQGAPMDAMERLDAERARQALAGGR